MSDQWPSLPLSDLTTKIGSGATPKGGKNAYQSDGIPLIRSMNVYDLVFEHDGLAFLDAKQATGLDNVIVQQGDVLLNITGASVARCCIAPADMAGARVNQHVAIIRPIPSRIDGRFLAYKLATDPHKSRLLSIGSAGATREALTKGGLERYEVECPPIGVQRRIGDILSAYDDLIGNNTRRIAILEDMARRLFEEWFLSDGKAGRWVELETLCDGKTGIQTGPFGSQLHKEDYSEEGVPVVMPKNMADLKIREEGVARITTELANTMPRHILRNGDVVYGRRGDIGRRAFVTERESGWFCGTGCLRIRPNKDKISPRYLFDALGLPATDGAIKGRAHGATMPNLSAGLMKSVPVFLPTMEVQARYASLVDPLFDLAASLEVCNTNLNSTRDLLLPKLISGEIEIRVAEEALETAAA
ncbi:MAG: hypothetical protein JWR80_6197 [Bradyrhizobium sp.]|nr:hypothetical protein [Bradyrhizobium sp.]